VPQKKLRRSFIDFEEIVAAIGHDGDGFAYDNEGPRHRALFPAFRWQRGPVTNGEFIRFIEDNGYSAGILLSLGWMTVNEHAGTRRFTGQNATHLWNSHFQVCVPSINPACHTR